MDDQWRSWLRHCATSRKVLGSTAGGVLGHFQVTQCFCPHLLALEATQPLTEKNTKEFPCK